MAKSKAELESQYSGYNEAFAQATAAHAAGELAAAVELACQSWAYLDGMIQYARKYEGQDSADAIHFVLKHAPLLLDAISLDRLEAFLKENRRVAKQVDVADRLVQARDLLMKAHQLLGHVAQHSEVRQDELRRNLGGDQECWRWIVEMCDGMGFLQRIPIANSYRISLVSRMDVAIQAKCPACGVVIKGQKPKLLDAQYCPRCRQAVQFVLL